MMMMMNTHTHMQNTVCTHTRIHTYCAIVLYSALIHSITGNDEWNGVDEGRREGKEERNAHHVVRV